MQKNNIQSSRLFTACCFALVVTSMTFAIRAGILTQLSTEFGLDDIQLGWINSMAFLGFPLAMMFGGLIYNKVGAKNLLLVAFVFHVLGLVLTIIATGFWGLLISTFFIGFANGAVEAGCNPLITRLYHNNKSVMLSKFHVWFPGGIVIGAILSKLMTDQGIGWQWQVATMFIPAIIYGILVLKENFPDLKPEINSTLLNIKALASPLFLFMAVCMTLTAVSEFLPQQWIERILSSSGASPMLILALITGIMAAGRYFAGAIIHKINPAGVLLVSAIVATLGIYSMSIVSGNLIYISAILFALGVTYFWPTMIGFVAENVPQSGALGMSLIGGAGMFAVSIWNPIIGSWLETAQKNADVAGLDKLDADLIAGQAVLSNLSLFPFILIGCFSLLFIYMKKKETVI